MGAGSVNNQDGSQNIREVNLENRARDDINYLDENDQRDNHANNTAVKGTHHLNEESSSNGGINSSRHPPN